MVCLLSHHIYSRQFALTSQGLAICFISRDDFQITTSHFASLYTTYYKKKQPANPSSWQYFLFFFYILSSWHWLVLCKLLLTNKHSTLRWLDMFGWGILTWLEAVASKFTTCKGYWATFLSVRDNPPLGTEQQGLICRLNGSDIVLFVWGWIRSEITAETRLQKGEFNIKVKDCG